ncbi:MAG: hypothetical protein AB7G44_13570 [Bacteroidia bacterium]
MSYSLVHRPAVKDDITAAVDYYKQISPELARQFLMRLREAREYIAKYPAGFQINTKT